MSRVFFLSANVTAEPHPVYPLGMAAVAASLAARGHRVTQHDHLAEGRSPEALAAAVAAADPEVVCLSLRNLDNVDALSPDGGWTLDGARRLVQVIRGATGAPVIVGGPAFSLLPEEILDYLGADHGVVGEGEEAAPALVETLAAGRSAPRLARGRRPVDGAELPTPLLDPKLVAYYLREAGMVGLQTKRGCPHACTYCTYPVLEGRRFRPRPPGAVADDVERLGRDFGVTSFFFTDSVFNDDEGHAVAVAEELLRRELAVRWCAYFRPAGLGPAEVALFRRAGLYAAELGTDAASDAVLDALGKGFGFDEVVAAHRALVDARVPCAHFVMFGGPGETEATVAEGLSNLAALDHAVVFAYAGIRLLPGTALARRAEAEGVLAPGASLLRPAYYHAPGVDPGALAETLRAGFRGRRDRIFPPEEGQKRLDVMRRFGFQGLLWDHLVTYDAPRARSRG